MEALRKTAWIRTKDEREEFEEEFGRKVRNVTGNSRGVQEKAVHKWSSEMQRAIQPEERRREASERQSMGQEDSNSPRRRAWKKIWDPRVLAWSPFLAAGN